MLSRILDAGHKAIVLGLVGLTVAGSYTIGSGLYELQSRRRAFTIQQQQKQQQELPIAAKPPSESK